MAFEQPNVPHWGKFAALSPATALDCKDLVDYEDKCHYVSFNIVKPRIIIEQKPGDQRKATLRFVFQVKIKSDHQEWVLTNSASV